MAPSTSSHPHTDFSKTPSDIPTTKNLGITGTEHDMSEDSSPASKNTELLDQSTAASTTFTQANYGSEPSHQISPSPQSFQHSIQDLPEHHESHIPSADHTHTLPPHTSGQLQSPITAEQKTIKRHHSDSSSLEGNNTTTNILEPTTPNPGNDYP